MKCTLNTPTITSLNSNTDYTFSIQQNPTLQSSFPTVPAGSLIYLDFPSTSWDPINYAI
jgi:hypothetical protein